MESGGEQSIRSVTRKARFWCLALPVLIIAYFGIHNALVKPGFPFTCEARGRALVLTRVLSSAHGLQPGDTLLAVGGYAVPHYHDIEFALDEHCRGDTVLAAVRRTGGESAVPVATNAWYGRTLVFIKLLFGAVLWGIGVFVLWKKQAEKPARVLFYLTQSLACVIFITNAHFPAGPRPWNFILPNFYYLMYSVFPALLLHFSLIFPVEKTWIQKNPRIKAALYIPAMVLAPLILFVHSRAVLTKLHEHYTVYYVIFNVLRGYNLLYFLLSLVSLISSHAGTRLKSDKNKVRWILWGFAMGSFPFMILWTLPLMLGFRPLVPEEATDLALLAAPVSFAIAIVRYQVFDIELLINRSLVYGVLTALLSGLYLMLVGLIGNLALTANTHANAFLIIAFTMLAVVFFTPVKNRVQAWVDKTFYRLKYNYKAATRELGARLASAAGTDDIFECLIETVCRTLPVQKAAVLGFHDGDLTPDRMRGFSDSEKNALQFRPALGSIRDAAGTEGGLMNPASTAALPTVPELKKAGVHLIVPIGAAEARIGALALGEKLSGVRYVEDDLDLISALLHETSLAVQRIRLQEAALLERNKSEHLEKLNRLKSDFVSHVSHELRTPLASMITGVRNLLDGIPEHPSGRVKSYLKGVHDSGQYLNRMIINLLDTARIEADKLELNPERVSLESMVGRTIETLAPFAAEKSIRLESGSLSGFYVQADPDALFQILSNLVENAVKYSPKEQTVRIHAGKTLKIADGNEWVAVSVEDRGIGIPADRQGSVFGRFERIIGKDSPRQKGLGLGLYIAKKLVEAQGGTLSVKSEPGRGSTFTFILPSLP